MGELRLFKQVLSCKKCLFSWEGYAHGFSRGHSVLIRDNDILFIPDDIWYLFPKDTDFDIERLFFKIGYRGLESCPKCRSTELFPPAYDQNTLDTVNCSEVQRKDFQQENDEWVLSPEALRKYAQEKDHV